ncbi:MAG: hypothetical protein J2P31_08520, partial [Blastocatellia bacterium]|nr:hypothetical protein [Blastocatellia bacterium]
AEIRRFGALASLREWYLQNICQRVMTYWMNSARRMIVIRKDIRADSMATLLFYFVEEVPLSNDERDKLMLFLIERHEELLAELNLLKDAQLRVNTQIEKLNKVVVGVAQQIDKLVRKVGLEKEEEDWRKTIRIIKRK